MSSAAVSAHSGGAGTLSLMSCVRETSPLQDFDSDTEKNVTTKKKFWNRIKWFKRKNKVIEDSGGVLPVSDYMQTTESLRSRSTSELSIEEPPRKRTGSSMYPGMSVSHDSVFHSPHSGSSETDLDAAHSSSSLCISGSQPQADLQNELSERLRLRRSGGIGRGDTSEDDEGLPHSPCNSPTKTTATTTDNLSDKTAIKDLPNKSHIDGSLLSVGSSDAEEDLLQLARNSSKSSSPQSESDGNASSAPLNHSAAHHRVAVRPKKAHGIPRRKKANVVELLPTTIEVNEDLSFRSSSPEFDKNVPPGDDHKLNRSRSNETKSQENFEEQQHKEEKCSFFERLFPRRSAKKKKSKGDETKKKMKLEEEKHESEVFVKTEKYNVCEENSYRKNETKQPIPAARSGAVYRQRMIPIDIPDYPVEESNNDEVRLAKNQLPDILSTSPLQMELESKLKQRLTSSSPSKGFDFSEQQQQTSIFVESKKSEDHRSRMKLAGLSSLQQKVMNLNEDIMDTHQNYKSLIEFPSSPTEKSTTSSSSNITKSQSFKTTKIVSNSTTSTIISNKTVNASEQIINKATSLDSVKFFEVDPSRKFEIKEDKSKNFEYVSLNMENDNLDEQITRNLMETKRLCEETNFETNNVTISGPSHTAIVNVNNNGVEQITKKQEQQISITKINVVQPENEEIATVDLLEKKTLIINRSPKITQIKEKQIFNFDKQQQPRKFSKEDVEIVDIDKEIESPKTPPATFNFTTSPTTSLFKKNIQKKPSVVSITSDSSMKDDKSSLTSYYKSSSLDSLISDNLDSTDKSSQDSLDNIIDKQPASKNDTTPNVILRKKSSVKKTKDDEPELMKVFARRSLKLKDSENESLSQQLSVMMNDEMMLVDENNYCDKTRDSDKENQSIDSPVKERRKSSFKIEKLELGNNTSKENEKETFKPLTFEIEKKNPEPLNESNVIHSKPIPIRRSNLRQENNNINSLIENTTNSEVTLRKQETQQQQQRSVSISSKSIDNSQNILRKQFLSRRRTDNWITNMKNEECNEEKKVKDENSISPKEIETTETPTVDLIIEPKNFNQRKAEWEKRAQDAQKKSTP